MRCNFLRTKAISMAFLIICVSFSISMFSPSAFAAPSDMACCEKTTTGLFCKTATEGECDTSFEVANFQPCEQTSFCKVGCCVSPNGVCASAVSEANCLSTANNIWLDDAACGYEECTKACCVIAEQECTFVTEAKCEKIMTQFPVLEMDFRDNIQSELECVGVCMASEKGCCVLKDGCEYTTRGMCGQAEMDPNKGTGFFEDVFCSADVLNKDREGEFGKIQCKCKPHYETRCVEGQEDVYWFDSCGNKEDVAQSCDYSDGWLCGLVDGKPKCKSVNCASTYTDDINQAHESRMGGFRQNGEAWCVYNSKAVGEFKDRPGSRHFRHICINGEEMVEPCRDFREQACIQNPMSDSCEGEKGDTGFTEARCVDNEIYNSGFNTNITTVPKGGKFWDPKDSKLTEACSEAEIECPMYWMQTTRYAEWACMQSCGCTYEDEIEEQMGKDSDFSCEDQVDCESQKWADDMAGYCRAQGDCGNDYNIMDKSTETGFYINGKLGAPNKGDSIECLNPDEPWSEKKKCQWDDKAAEITGMSDATFGEWGSEQGVCGGLWGVSLELEEMDEGEPGPPSSWVWMEPVLWSATMDFVAIALLKHFQSNAVISELLTGGIPAKGVGWWGGAAGVAGVMAAADLGAKLLTTGEITGPDVANTVTKVVMNTVLTKVLPRILGKQAAKQGATSALKAALGPVGWALLVFDLALTFWSNSGGGTEDVSVASHCKPWEPPKGGTDCKLCDLPKSEGGLLPDIDGKILPGYSCSEYMCKSLGAACSFIKENEGIIGKPACYEDHPNDVVAPKIERWDETFSVLEGQTDTTSAYSIAPIATGYQITPYLKAYSMVTFGIKADEAAQCKYSETHTPNYDSMTGTFNSNPYYDFRHNVTINIMPEKKYEFFVRCVDPHGNGKDSAEYEIKFEAATGPDLTSPLILGTSLANGAFIAANKNLTQLTVYLNEPSSCKWSNLNQAYEMMPTDPKNIFLCPTSTTRELGRISYKCIKDLPTSLGTNQYYIACEDKSENKNKMAETYPFTLIGTAPLNISQLMPAGDLYNNNITLQVTTVGGAESGKAECSFGAVVPVIEFLNTNAATHSQPLYLLPKGDYAYKIECTDKGGNIADGEINFKITQDVAAPLVSYLWIQNNVLYITTTESANCEYASNETFDFGTGTKAAGDGTTAHSGSVAGDETFVICADVYNNPSSPIMVTEV